MKLQEQAPNKSPEPHPFSEDKLPESSCQGFSSSVQRTIIEENRFEVYPNCVVFTPTKYKKYESTPPAHRRSKISSFSPRSRFRLFTALGKIKKNLTNKPFFVTLTYHYGFRRKDVTTKDNLHNFLVSLRDYDNSVQFIWRIEYQKRGAPHYHLLIFPGCPEKKLNRKKYFIHICQIWHHIADSQSTAHEKFGCKIVEIDNYRKACAYMSKYIAKLPDGAIDITEGKHWGNSRKLPFFLFKTIEGCSHDGHFVIEKIRKWFLANGKIDYASDYYFNTERPQVIFIEAEEFFSILGHNTSNMDFSDL